MKVKFKNIALSLLAALFVFAACEKEEQIKLAAQAESWNTEGITSTSADLSGMVVAQGEGIKEYGVTWSTEENPSIETNKKVADEVEGAVYWITVDGLEHLTKYYYKAYVIQNNGTVLYGEQKDFRTLAHVATVTLGAAEEITARTAKFMANVPYDGKSEVTEKGICWSMEAAPTAKDDKEVLGEGLGEFSHTIVDLMPNTMYYVRSYAINAIDTAYSNEVSFTTLKGLAVVETGEATDITKIAATIHGNAIHDGGSAISERGFVYGLTENPTVNDTKVVDTEITTGEYSAGLENLDPGVTYHVRAYVINETGVSYGANVPFTTVPDIVVWYIPGDYVEASYPVGDYVNWNPGSSPFVRNTLEVGDKLEGYVYMANANNSWKFASKPNWDGPNYGDSGVEGELSDDPGAGNFSNASGYYKINVDMSTTPYTYTAVKTDWGVIGDATPGDWGTSTDLSYDPASQTWKGVVHMVAGSFKFRANNGWDYNYGSNTGDENLVAGGDNISNEVEADYEFILDLSDPNTYKYAAYRWGIIGDATPGGWDTDTDMTWDASNSVFTITADLTVGQFKFRANDDWGMNLGGALDGLTEGGDNIDIAEAGNYTITLNRANNTATVVKN